MRISFTALPKLLILCSLFGLSACVSHQELVNFNEGQAFPVAPEIIAGIPELRIQPRDVLAISVQTLQGLNPADVAPFSTQSSTAAGGGTNNNISYQVDSEGYIDFPMIGRIRLENMTVYEAKDTITAMLREDFKNPVVNVRFTSFKFTVLGEVTSKGTFTLPDERVSILDALGMAGDLTVYANRTNILIVREQNGLREYGTINLHDRQLFNSPYFYLRPNDFIYVEPLKEKVGTVSDQFTKVLPWLGAGTALLNLILILTRN